MLYKETIPPDLLFLILKGHPTNLHNKSVAYALQPDRCNMFANCYTDSYRNICITNYLDNYTKLMILGKSAIWPIAMVLYVLCVYLCSTFTITARILAKNHKCKKYVYRFLFFSLLGGDWERCT